MPILEKSCPICGAAFTCWQRPRREVRTCSPTCGAQLRRQSERKTPRVSARRPRPAVTCQHCGQPFVPKARRRNPMFCGKSCSMKARWADAAMRAKLIRGSQNWPEERRVIAREHAPWMNGDATIRAKSAATTRSRTFCGARGGNGQLTPAQLLLHEALGWPMEHPIRTGNPSWPVAVVDLAEPKLKIAIECDGRSHYSRKQRNRDTRKTTMLAALGWTVLRFWNSQITGGLAAVLDTIRSCERAAS